MTIAYGVYQIESLAASEAIRARTREDAAGRRNCEFARKKRLILKENRMFLKSVSAPGLPPRTAP